MRLIDGDSLRDYMWHICGETDEEIDKGRAKWESGLWIRYKVLEDALENAPTIDAEQVVRCKDCDYCKRYNEVWRFPKIDELVCTLYVETYHTTENDYCSRGERREDGKD